MSQATAEKLYDNTNSGALFKYSDTEMRGTWENNKGHKLDMYGRKSDNGLTLIVKNDGGEIIATGFLERAEESQNPDAPQGRGELTFFNDIVDGDVDYVLKLAAWIKLGKKGNYYSIAEDTFEPSAGVFFTL